MSMSTRSTPTVVLVHGAFADASGFGGVIRELQSAGHTVVAPPNPLRSLAFDAAAIAAFVGALGAPAVLVGHSYGDAVITQASAGLDNVTALVYLAAFHVDNHHVQSGPKGVDVLAQQPFLGYPRSLGARQVEQGGKQSGANAATWRDYIELCRIDSGARLGSWTTIDTP